MLKGNGKYAEFPSLQGDSRHKVDKVINVTEQLLSEKMGRPFSMDTSMYRQALAEVRASNPGKEDCMISGQFLSPWRSAQKSYFFGTPRKTVISMADEEGAEY